MPPVTPASKHERYIIRASAPARLAAFIHDIAGDADAEVLDLIGPQDAPHTAVVAMPPQKAAGLAQHFQQSNELTIEPDRPLSLFGEA